MGKINESVIEEIKARVVLSDLVGRTVRLKRAGREMRGLSPFNAEKTPSFYVNDAKNFYHCFSSGKHGNCFSWMMEMEGMSFPEAVEALADEYGVTITREAATREANAQRAVRENALDALNAAQEFFVACLKRTPHAIAYLESRGITRDMMQAVGMGFAPDDRFILRRHLEAKGFTLSCLIAAGLLVHGEEVSVPYGFYRNRITFPIRDRRGKPISFGARALGDGQPKYLNGAQSALFDKSRALYGIERAAGPIAKAGQAIVMEGYLDVEQAQAHGITNAVAPLGTAVTPEQLHVLWKLAPTVVLCLDGDNAGEKAGDRLIESVIPYLAGDRRLAFALLPRGQDPDDLIRAAGPEPLRAMVANAQSFDDRLWDMLRRVTPGDHPEDRAKVEKHARELVSLIADPDTARAYGDEMRRRAAGIGRRRPAPRLPSRGGDNGIPAREAALVLAAIEHPDYVESDLESFASADFSAPITARLRDMVLDALARGVSLDPASVAREAAMLRERLPAPVPSFLEKENVAGFRDALDFHREVGARRRLRLAAD